MPAAGAEVPQEPNRKMMKKRKRFRISMRLKTEEGYEPKNEGDMGTL
jgi:hypothetical protein